MFWTKRKAKVGKTYKWYPCAHIVGKPVDTQELGEAIARNCTASPADVHAVLRSLPEVMADFMENGRTIRMDGLGSFFYKLSCTGKGVDTPEEVSAEQVQSIRVQFIPSRKKTTEGFVRSLVQRISLIEFGSDKK